MRRVKRPVSSLLDIGPGIMPAGGFNAHVHILAEPCNEYIEKLRVKYVANSEKYIVIKGLAEEILQHFPESSIDVIAIIDVIEHMPKETGMKVIELAKKVAKNNIVLFTPLGFLEQEHADGKDAWGMNGGEWQKHLSGWYPEDFQGSGWEYFVLEDFHLLDTHGMLRSEPAGAFYAVYTKPLL